LCISERGKRGLERGASERGASERGASGYEKRQPMNQEKK
jgi:hypothetical protein